MIYPYCFSDKNLTRGFKIVLDSHKTNHANSILTISPLYSDFDDETRYIKKIVREMATIYARLKNQYKFKCHLLFSASFRKINEEDQTSDEIELFINLKLIIF